jgi:hypothetical protein
MPLSRALLIISCLSFAAPFCGAVEFYVAPKGDDADPGTSRKPFATLTRARDAVRDLLKRGGLPSGAITVTMRGGEYRMAQTLELGAADSCTAKQPVIWQAAPKEAVALSGGVRLTDFRQVSAPAILSRLSPEAREHVLQVNLKALGVTDFGEVDPASGRRAEIFFNHKYMTLARYPNEGWLRIASVPQEGELKFPGDFRDTEPTRINGQIAGRHYGRFCYDGDRPSHWQWPSDIWVHGFWVWDYSEQYHPVERLDTAKKEVWPRPPYHFYGYHQGARYCFLNVLEELDSPGEWYLDRTAGLLYFWPPVAPVPADADISFPVLSVPMVSLKDASNIQLRGLTFECSRAGGVAISGGAGNLIAGCTFRNLGGTAVTIAGGGKHGVQSCDIYEVGAGGVTIEAGDRKTLAPAGCFVANCHIHDIGRVIPTYRPAISLNGVGNRVSHCYIHDCPHQGLGYTGNDHVIEFCEFTRTGVDAGDVGAIGTGMDWTYYGHTFRYNYFHNIHSPARVHVGSMTIYLDLPCGGTHIYGNVFYDNQRAFFTNSGRDCLIENNIFVNCDPSIQFNSWRDMILFKPGGAWRMTERLDEVHYDQPPYSTRYPGLLRLFNDGDPRLPTGNVVRCNVSYGGRFLQLHPLVSFKDVRVERNLIADPMVFEGSLTADGQDARYVNGDAQIARALGQSGNVIMSGDPGFADIAGRDFGLKPSSPAWKLGFKPIPFDQIGLRRDEFRKSVPLPEPDILPGSRTFAFEMEVALRLPSRGPRSVIRYTLDGSDPTTQSPRYTRPFTLNRTTTVKAAAFAADGHSGSRSPTVSATLTAAPLGPGGALYLSDLEGFDILAHGGLKRDTNYSGGVIKLNGKEYARGLMLCPEATRPDYMGGLGHVTYAIEGGLKRARRFKAVIGIEDEMLQYNRGTATFAVEVLRGGKWERVYESGVIKLGPPQPVDVDITGVQQLRLITTDADDNIQCDHAVWAEARIE